MALESGLAALAGFAESIRDQLMAAAAAAGQARSLRAAGDEVGAEAVVSAVFDNHVFAERRAFEQQILKLDAETANQQTELALAAQSLTAEREAREAAERALEETCANLATAQGQARALVAQAAASQADVVRLTRKRCAPSALEAEAGGPLPPGPLPSHRPLFVRPLAKAQPGSPPGARVADPSTAASRGDGADAQDETRRGSEEKRDEEDEGGGCAEWEPETWWESSSCWSSGDSDAKRTRRGDAAWSASGCGGARGSGGARATGGDMPPPHPAEDEPRFWPAWQNKAGKWHDAGYKVHVRDLPKNLTQFQFAKLLDNAGCPKPCDTNPGLKLSPRGRSQVVLTFAAKAEAVIAKEVLNGRDMEPGKHATQTKWFQSSHF